MRTIKTPRAMISLIGLALTVIFALTSCSSPKKLDSDAFAMKIFESCKDRNESSYANLHYTKTELKKIRNDAIGAGLGKATIDEYDSMIKKYDSIVSKSNECFFDVLNKAKEYNINWQNAELEQIKVIESMEDKVTHLLGYTIHFRSGIEKYIIHIEAIVTSKRIAHLGDINILKDKF